MYWYLDLCVLFELLFFGFQLECVMEILFIDFGEQGCSCVIVYIFNFDGYEVIGYYIIVQVVYGDVFGEQGELGVCWYWEYKILVYKFLVCIVGKFLNFIQYQFLNLNYIQGCNRIGFVDICCDYFVWVVQCCYVQ